MTREEFLSRIRAACVNARARGAKFNEQVVVAQAALESSWGRSTLAVEANNLFGTKAGRDWKGPVLELPTSEWHPKKGWYRTVARWRHYESWSRCIEDYAAVIARFSWFRDALAHLDDPDKFLEALMPRDGEPGWATDPAYYRKVKQVMQSIERLERGDNAS